MRKIMKENKGWICLLGGVFLIGIPVIVYLLSSVPLLPIGGNNDWAGFWGGYLGALMGAFVAIFVMKQTIENEKTVRREESQEKFLSDIIELVAEFAAQVNRSNSNLLRFHDTGESNWNFEAVYGMTEVAKLENIIYIKILANQRDRNDLIQDLLNKILEVGKEAENLHTIHYENFEGLKKDADKISIHLSELMEQAMKFVAKN